MQTITVKYLGPTNTKPSRIKAVTSGGDSITRSFDYEGGFEFNACKVAKELKLSLGWAGKMTGGHQGDNFVFVFDNDAYIIE